MRHTFISRIILGLALTVIVLTLLITGSAAAWGQQRPGFNGQQRVIQGGYPALGINGTRFDAQGRYLRPEPIEAFPAGLSSMPAAQVQPMGETHIHAGFPTPLFPEPRASTRGNSESGCCRPVRTAKKFKRPGLHSAQL